MEKPLSINIPNKAVPKAVANTIRAVVSALIDPIYFTPYISAQVDDGAEDDEEIGDDFESMYKGEISKSGTPILPSKRARKTPEKIQVSQEDLAELSETAKPDVDAVSYTHLTLPTILLV